MNEEYLWDGSGTPDPETARIESALHQFSYRRKPRRRTGRAALAIAATLIAALAGVWFGLRTNRVSSWQLSLNGEAAHALRIGQRIDTGDAADAVLESEASGRVEIAPGSRVRLVEDRQGSQTFALERGLIHALIWAPPRTFVVETPSARTVDLGCQYTLRVGEDGHGTLRVETGWVAFVLHGRESFIPAGAICQTRPQRGPGTPYFEDASSDFKSAIDRLDEGDRSALAAALASARAKDALSLWHLMTRVPRDQRGPVFDRFAQLTPLPYTVRRDAIERADPEAIDAAWNALHLGSTDWWRGWERRW